jgi:hypothetical protein
VKILKSYNLILLLLFYLIDLSVAGQTLPPNFKPDFLSSNTILVHIGDQLGTKLTFSASMDGAADCCNNFFTGEPMKNYSFSIIVENKSPSSVYFVRMPKNGLVLAKGRGNSPVCDFSMQAYIGIWADDKSFRLDPGQQRVFKAKTKMDYQNYYPVTQKNHDELISSYPKALEPNCLSFIIYSKVYTKNNIQSILATINNSKNAQSNGAGSDQNDDNGLNSFIDDIENEFDNDIANASNESDTIDPKGINKEAAKLVIVSETSESEVVSKTKYNLNLCNNLIQENRQIISGFKSYLNNHQSDEWDRTYEQFKSLLNRRQTALEKGTLNPDCMEKMKRDWDSYQQESDRILDAQINKLNQELGGILNGVATPVNSNSGFTPIPSTMTTTPTRQTPLIKTNKFGTGKVAPLKKKVTN